MAALLVLIPSLIAAEEPRTIAGDFWRQAASWPDSLSSDQLIMASLAASGVSVEDWDSYAEKLGGLVNKLNEDFSMRSDIGTNYARGEALLVWLHENVFSTYSYHQTKLDVLLDSGEQNCVSSSVFYLLFARLIGLDVSAEETKDHVFCVVETDDGPIDVETTVLYGFDPGTKREFTNEFDQTGYTYVPPGNYRNRFADTDKELVGLILQNRMAQLQRSRDHLETVGLAVDRHTFVGSDKTKKDLIGVLQNWVAELSDAGKDLEAFEFLAEAATDTALLEEQKPLFYQLVYNILVPLMNQDENETAVAFLDDNSRFIALDKAEELDSLVMVSFLTQQAQVLEYNEAIALMREAQDGNFPRSRWIDLTVMLNSNHAFEIGSEAGWRDGLDFYQELPEEEQNLRGMTRVVNVLKQNWTAEIHNRYVELARDSLYSQARSVLEEGLIHDPDNRTFKTDLSNLDKILSRTE